MSMKNVFALMKNNKELEEVIALGKQYDNETDPEKKEALKKEIDDRCAALKEKLKGVPLAASSQNAGTGDQDQKS